MSRAIWLRVTIIAVGLAFVACSSSRPAPGETARQYLQSWQAGRFEEMYALVSAAGQAATPRDRFVERYRAITEGAAIVALQTTMGQPIEDASGPSRDVPQPVRAIAEWLRGSPEVVQARIPFEVTLRSRRLGEVREQNVLPLVFEDGRWRVEWTPGLIFQGLTADRKVRVFDDDPVRGSILDRKGRLLAGKGATVSIGVVPGKVTDEPRLLAGLSRFLGLAPEVIRARYANGQPDWFMPVAELPLERLNETKSQVESLPGAMLQTRDSRVYPGGSAAGQTLGYVGEVTADDLKQLGARGYEEGDRLGRSGLEAWAEETLAGEKGGRLIIVSPEGKEERSVVRRPARQGGTVHLTLDLELQRRAEQLLGDRAGSVVVLDPRDGALLALASRPGFDPNRFVLGLSSAEWQRLQSDPKRPFLNRPIQAAYPTGSIFKITTMAAGLERGGFTPESPFECRGSWQGLPGQTMGDWLPQGHGRLNLSEGLAQSCNIVFYEIGKRLDDLDPTVLPSFGRAFGFGQPTGLVGLEEASGTLPDPTWKQRQVGQAWYTGDGVNLAIGQGYFEATPLQVANAVAAIARGGELRTPLLVRQTVDAEGKPIKRYASEVRSRLPLSARTLAAIQQSMRAVVGDPKGTAYEAFPGFRNAAGKTGSAETSGGRSHAWFAGYAPADTPRAVAVVMVEDAGLGALVAAPIGRQMLEAAVRE